MKTRILCKETLLYRGASLVHIDKAKDALYWCKRHGMTFVETIAFFNDTATTEIYTLSLHDALPIVLPFAQRREAW